MGWEEESPVIQKVLYNDWADLEQIHLVPSVLIFKNQKALSDSQCMTLMNQIRAHVSEY